MKTLAEQLFEFSDLEMELFEKVNEILECDTDKCLAPDFVFGAIDTLFDEYDMSVEVFRAEGANFMSREQANQILDLGFGRVYENCGSRCRAWDRGSYFEAQSKFTEGKKVYKSIASKLQSKLELAKANCDTLLSLFEFSHKEEYEWISTAVENIKKSLS
jgi:hypothetical protein